LPCFVTLPISPHDSQPIIKSHHCGERIITRKIRVDCVHRDAHPRLLVVELVYENRDAIVASLAHLLPPLRSPPPAILVRFALDRVKRDLDIAQIVGLILIEVALARHVETMASEKII